MVPVDGAGARRMSSVPLLTIGAFARAARLTPKALRLYDRLGLLPPAAVDPDSGYRLYDQRQLAQARLIAQLRIIGMPLAEIRTLVDLPADAAAQAVAEYWHRVSADTAQRAQLASLLVQYLSGKDTSMANTSLRGAAATDIGAVRTSNEDCAYASSQLLAVADGGGVAGTLASAAAIDALKAVALADRPVAELLSMVADAVAGADRAVRASAADNEQPITTLTALLRRSSRLVLVHVGDTRAYLLRGGDLVQLTQDHSWVRTEVDAGRLEPAQLVGHPQRALLVHALGAGGAEVEADLGLRTALPGDRYLLCSDGLWSVLEPVAVQAALQSASDPDDAVRELIGLAHAAGAPDNIACVVADFR